MGTNTLETAYSNGEVIDASHINELTSSVVNQFVGRNTSGVPEAGKSLGTAALPWGTGYMSTLILNGSAVDASQITSVSNRIISGAERTDSGQPKFITPDGTLATMTLNGATTNLVASINGVTTTVSTDIVKTSLTTAPVVTNAVLVNDTTIISDKFAGENDYYYDRANGKKGYITLDTAGANVTSEVGQMVALKGTTEIMFGHLESATKITNVNRGFFFDSSGSPIVREALSNNDTLTIMSVGWVFVEDNGTTVDVSYLTPFWGFASPGSPATGQYWFDITNQTWKRYSGTEFVIINRIPVGIVVIDGTACIASRSFDFANSFSDANNVEVTINSTEIIESISLNNKFNVYGSSVVQDATKIQWNITTDLESGVVEASSTMYYLYISDEGESVIGDERPLLRSDLGGHYHPYHNWRCLGAAYNDGSSDLTMVTSFKYNLYQAPKTIFLKDVKTSGTNGGTFTSGAWQTRDMLVLNESGGVTNVGSDAATLLSNQFSFIVGKWLIRADAIASYVRGNKTKLRNTGDSEDLIIGTNTRAGGATADEDSSISALYGSVIFEDVKTLELQHRCDVTRASTGFGSSQSYGVEEIYSNIYATELR